MNGDDPFDLDRFVQAQSSTHTIALAELTRGLKRSHWMWYIFPQFAGLGFSSTSQLYAIKSVDEAKAYLCHPILGPRLIQCAEAALAVKILNARQIFGSPDDMKLRSCATLFASVSPPGSVFHKLLDRYFDGEPDPKTLTLLQSAGRA